MLFETVRADSSFDLVSKCSGLIFTMTAEAEWAANNAPIRFDSGSAKAPSHKTIADKDTHDTGISGGARQDPASTFF